MNGIIRKAGLALALGATALTAAAPAEAQRYYGRGYHHHGGNAAGAAVIGGLLGLGVGAAIASSNRPYYYDRGYGYYAAAASAADLSRRIRLWRLRRRLL